MIAVAVSACLFALASQGYPGTIAAVALIPVVVPAFLTPTGAARLLKRTVMILLVSWVVFPWLGIVYQPFPVESMGRVLGAITVWLLLSLALGWILSLGFDCLNESGSVFRGFRD